MNLLTETTHHFRTQAGDHAYVYTKKTDLPFPIWYGYIIKSDFITLETMDILAWHENGHEVSGNKKLNLIQPWE